MNRQIKFKGKRKDGTWAYGDLVHLDEGCIIITSSSLTVDNYLTEDNALVYSEKEIAVVFPETVGQFTGLTDKNGKEVFEGDLLSDGKGGIGEVRYNYRLATYCIHSDGDIWFFNEGNPSRSTKLEYTEIIGSIHDKKGGKDE